MRWAALGFEPNPNIERYHTLLIWGYLPFDKHPNKYDSKGECIAVEFTTENPGSSAKSNFEKSSSSQSIQF
jgi:hypothetical protein